MRFFKGAQAIVTGCLPADAAYFTVYGLMRRHFGYNNESFNFLTTASMGAGATIAHDFFITPGDSKELNFNLNYLSDQVEVVA